MVNLIITINAAGSRGLPTRHTGHEEDATCSHDVAESLIWQNILPQFNVAAKEMAAEDRSELLHRFGLNHLVHL
jgi:hypothetical protein